MELQKWIDKYAPALEADTRRILDAYPRGARRLRERLLAGRIDGAHVVPFDGCACLIGTVTPCALGIHDRLTAAIRMRREAPDPLAVEGWWWEGREFVSSEGMDTCPAERLASAIRPGDTPETNPAAAFALAVVDAWLAERAG